ncbi:GNAT family N-acetyltransferase [Aminobacter sp. LjRoot7]|uniref:GNAT family N-acetyltransferase n=1 Tax=Aminobacter sp. LjRoot7 TaxID=3342335 RepID=UPI003ECC5256
MGKPAEAKVPVAAVINGRHGSLRPLDASDASMLYRRSHDENVAAIWAEMKVGPFADEAAFAGHIDGLVSDPKRAFFAVVDLQGDILGWLCLMEARVAHQVVELGYVLFTSGIQRTTLATEALYLVIRHVFEELGYRRLEWTCTAENSRSRVAADRLGFIYEGTLREGLLLKGMPRDICMYSMLSSEWPSRRATMEQWLDPANFRDGRQLRSMNEIRAEL